ncbi:MAG TPA: tetratricopeptide repeat protein, partial [Myxococcota bacterium]|nr:tetratricopeptide repeat protein [Myxococcota bacterium]
DRLGREDVGAPDDRFGREDAGAPDDRFGREDAGAPDDRFGREDAAAPYADAGAAAEESPLAEGPLGTVNIRHPRGAAHAVETPLVEGPLGTVNLKRPRTPSAPPLSAPPFRSAFAPPPPAAQAPPLRGAPAAPPEMPAPPFPAAPPVTALSHPEPSSDRILAPRRPSILASGGAPAALHHPPPTALEVPVPGGRRAVPPPDYGDDGSGTASSDAGTGPRAFDGGDYTSADNRAPGERSDARAATRDGDGDADDGTTHVRPAPDFAAPAAATPGPAPARPATLLDGLSAILDVRERRGPAAALDGLQLASQPAPHAPAAAAGPDPLDLVLGAASGTSMPLAGAADRLAPRFRWGALGAALGAAALLGLAGALLWFSHRARLREDSVREALALAAQIAADDTWKAYHEAADVVVGVDVPAADYPALAARRAYLEASLVVRFDLADVAALRAALARIPPAANPTSDATFAAAVLAAAEDGRTGADTALRALDAAADAFADEPSLEYLRGELRLRLGDEKAARKAFERALALDAGHVPSLVALGLLEAADGADGAAERRLTDALALSHDHAGALVARYRVLERRRSDTRAAAAALAALLAREAELAPRDLAWARLCLARHYLRSGDAPKMEALLAKLRAAPPADSVLQRETAALLLALGRTAEAAALCDGALRPDLAERDRAPLVTLAAFAALERGDTAGALARLGTLADARAPLPLYLRGRAELASGAAAKAAEDLAAARAADPTLLAAALWLGRAQVKLGLAKAAVETLSAAARAAAAPAPAPSPGPAAPAADRALEPARWVPPGALPAALGRAHLLAGNALAARRSFETALERDEADPDVHYDLAMLFRAAKDAPAKEKHLLRALELRADFPAARKELGALRALEGRYREALADLEPALAKDPIDAKLAQLLLEAALSESDAAGAERHLKELRSAGMGEVKLATWTARLQLCAGHGGEARKTAEAALPLAPRDAGLLSLMGEVALMGGDAKAARKLFETALASDHGHLRAALGLAEAFLRLGDARRAEDGFAAVVRRAAGALMPRRYTARAWLGLARAQLARHDAGRALESAAAAAALVPDWKEALVTEGRLAAEAHKAERARDAWARAAAVDPKDPEVRFGLAEALRATGAATDAVAAYKGYLEVAPTGKWRGVAEHWIAALGKK